MARRAWFLAAASVLLGGCLWRSYEEIMTVHLDVVSAMAEKAVASAEAGRRPGPNEVAEMAYPLRRARQFAQQYQSDRRRESYRLFVRILDRYEALVTAIDAARTDDQRWAGLQPRLRGERAALARAAARARAALQRGQ